MKQLFDAVVSLPWIKGHRTQVIQVCFVLYGVYNVLVANHLIPSVLTPDWETAVVAFLAAYGFKFSKEHQTGSAPTP